MAKDKKQKSSDDDLDLGALSALVRPSVPPAADRGGDGDADDAKLDLRALVASVPPPAMEAAPEPAPRAPAAEPKPADGKKTDAKKADAKKADTKQSEQRAIEAAPVVVAAPPQASNNNGLMIGLGVGLAVALGVFMMTRSGGEAATVDVAADTRPTSAHPPEAAATIAARAPREDELAEAPTPVAVEAPAIEAPAVEAPAVEAPAVEAPAVEAPAVAAVAPSARPSRSGSAAPEAAPAASPVASPTPEVAVEPAAERDHGRRATTTTTAAATPPAPPAAGGAHLDSVLDQALGAHPTTTAPRTAATPAARAATPAPSASLPDTPSQADVRRVLASVMPRIRECAGEQVGLAVATLMVRSDGSVTSAAVGGSPFGGTPQGSCMEGALRGAHFPAFRQQTFRVQYPMSIRPAS